MENKKNIIGYYIIASALLWGITIVACALILKSNFSKVSLILSGAAAIHLIIIWVPLAAQLKKQREQEKAK